MKKRLTLKQKVQKYEDFLHKINLACTCGDGLALEELISNADAWSYAHRQGNGELSVNKQEELIASKLEKLCNTPKADKRRKDLQEKRKEALDKLAKEAQDLKMGY
jgi:hypothetical protein